jgi:hypothetical protein
MVTMDKRVYMGATVVAPRKRLGITDGTIVI